MVETNNYYEVTNNPDIYQYIFQIKLKKIGIRFLLLVSQQCDISSIGCFAEFNKVVVGAVFCF